MPQHLLLFSLPLLRSAKSCLFPASGRSSERRAFCRGDGMQHCGAMEGNSGLGCRFCEKLTAQLVRHSPFSSSMSTSG
ncbi:uncharacterized protein J3D65DRAFT_324050 [Phyllosticta citribraziliensis]|uniref:Secreted protein n=1 Tax=Phyllosticta citribraziliensis TaxID=989973 RepID=A0ABR1LT53_9PEZI